MAGKDTASGRWSRGKSCDWEMWEDFSHLTEHPTKHMATDPISSYLPSFPLMRAASCLDYLYYTLPSCHTLQCPPPSSQRSFLPTFCTELSLPCMPLHTLSTTVYFINIKMLRVTNCIDTTEKQKRAST